MDFNAFERALRMAFLSSEYNQLFLQLKRLYNDGDQGDKKEAHRLQDIIYRKFIQDILDERIDTLEYIQVLSSQINDHVIKYDTNHEY